MPTFAPARGGFADPAAVGLMLGGLADEGTWYVDHLRHDDLTVYQTIQPENVHFVLNSRDKNTIDYEISMSATMPLSGSPVVSGPDFIHPRSTGWQLRRGAKVIDSGFHSDMNIVQGAEMMSVSGINWLGFFDLCLYPFDPTLPERFNIGAPPVGLAYEIAAVDISEIVFALWDIIFNTVSDRPPITYVKEFMGLNIPYFRVDWGDTTSFLSMLQSLADFSPGFDFWVEPDTLQLKLASPNRYGSNQDVVDGGFSGIRIVYNTDDEAPDIVEFTNSGPEYTHLLGTGAGLSTQLARALGTVLAEARYWRIDGTYDAGDVYDQDTLNGLTGQQLSYGLNPVHQIPVTVDPARISNFWDKMYPGVAIWVDEDLEAHQIDSPHKVVQMDCTVSKEGNESVDLGLNQIYYTPDDAGVVKP